MKNLRCILSESESRLAGFRISSAAGRNRSSALSPRPAESTANAISSIDMYGDIQNAPMIVMSTPPRFGGICR